MIWWIVGGSVAAILIAVPIVLLCLLLRPYIMSGWVREALTHPYLRGSLVADHLLGRRRSIDAKDRASLVMAFRGRDDVSTIKIKVAALRDPSSVVRRAAAESLTGTGGHPTFAHEVVPALRKACRDRDPSVRKAAQYALSCWEGWLKMKR